MILLVVSVWGRLLGFSRTPGRLSRFGFCASRTSSLFVARAKGAARFAELKAETSMLETSQVL